MEKVVFEAGDIVSWAGVEGVVVQSNINGDVLCEFDNEFNARFSKDGKLSNWHKEPSLKLVRKAKKKMKIERWANVYPGDFITIFNSKEDADKNYGAHRIACVKLTSEEFEV